MPLSALQLASAAGSLLFLFMGKKDGPGMGAGETAERQFLASHPGATHQDFLDYLAQRRLPPADGSTDSDSMQAALGPELVAYAKLEPWSGEWLAFWTKQMGVSPMPSYVRDTYNQGVANDKKVFGTYGRGGYVYALARGLIVAKGAYKNQDVGGAKAWAKDWVAACELYGPSKTIDKGLRFSWGPTYGLTVAGALRAEELGFRPSKWPWKPRAGHPSALQQVIHGDPAAEYLAGHAGFEVTKGIGDALMAIGGIAGIIGAAIKIGAGIGEKASHYDRKVGALTAGVDAGGFLTLFGLAQIMEAGGFLQGSGHSTDGDAQILGSVEQLESTGRGLLEQGSTSAGGGDITSQMGH